MSFTSFTTAELNQDKAIKSTTMKKIVNNLEWAKDAFQYNLGIIPNGGFELVTNNVPDLWDITTFSDGFVGVVSSAQSEGQNSLIIIHPGGTGNGGQAVSDFVPMSTLTNHTIYYQHWGSGIDAGVLFNTYDDAFNLLSTLGAYTTVRPPAIPSQVSTSLTLPAGARWIKVKIKTNTVTTVSGTVYYDNFSVSTATW